MNGGSIVAVLTLILGRFAGLRVFPRFVSVAVGNAADRERVANEVVRKVEALHDPDAADVIGGFLRGRLLVGVSDQGQNLAGVRFEWQTFERHSVLTEEWRHIPSKIRKLRPRLGFEVRFDDDVAAVVEACRRTDGTWITDEIVSIYRDLDRLGFASCISVHRDEALVGGMFGFEVGRTFCAMSVFHRVDHAGSIAWAALVEQVGPGGRWDLVHLGARRDQHLRFGAREISEAEFKARALEGLPSGSRSGNLPRIGPDAAPSDGGAGRGTR